MTAITFSDQQLDRAYAVSSAIGKAIRDARHARGERVEDFAAACRSHVTSVYLVERGVSPNVKLGNALRMLEHVGLTLAVVPFNEVST